jgi:hypothetical protein
MNKSIPILIFMFSVFSICLAEDPVMDNLNEVLLNRAELSMQVQDNLDDEMQGTKEGSEKSVVRSVLYSAVVPGLGQFYAKSYIKAGLFAAVEITAWVVNIHYNKLGDDKDLEYRQFADNNWSEYRYWSYVNYLNSQLADPEIDPYPYNEVTSPTGKSWYLIDDGIYNSDIISNLRTIEHGFPGHTHTLPETKTQQYYEMIGKYPEQFGNAWADASFDASYSGFDDSVTPMNDFYTDLSKESERLYDKAGYGSMTALINHVIAAVDAGFTTRRYNRKQLQMSYDNRRINGEYVNMFGVALVW